MNNAVDYWYKKYLNEKQKNEYIIEALRTEYEKGRADVIAEIQKHAWKPSEEQMKQLGWIAKQNKDNMIGKELISLYQDLKKLREG